MLTGEFAPEQPLARLGSCPRNGDAAHDTCQGLVIQVGDVLCKDEAPPGALLYLCVGLWVGDRRGWLQARPRIHSCGGHLW